MFHKVNECLSTPVDCKMSYSGQLVYSYEIESCWTHWNKACSTYVSFLLHLSLFWLY